MGWGDQEARNSDDFFLKINLNFGMILDEKESCNRVVQSPVYP